jgi:hypothetical protein
VAGAPRGRGERRRGLQRPWREFSAASFEVDSERTVAAGIDGEAVTLEPPLEFRILPDALRVRIARQHPGTSPSARVPESLLGTARALLAMAAGRQAAAG